MTKEEKKLREDFMNKVDNYIDALQQFDPESNEKNPFIENFIETEARKFVKQCEDLLMKKGEEHEPKES